MKIRNTGIPSEHITIPMAAIRQHLEKWLLEQNVHAVCLLCNWCPALTNQFCSAVPAGWFFRLGIHLTDPIVFRTGFILFLWILHRPYGGARIDPQGFDARIMAKEPGAATSRATGAELRKSRFEFTRTACICDRRRCSRYRVLSYGLSFETKR